MLLSRRQFLRSTSASALLASSHVLALAARRARAAGVPDPVIVLVNLKGGNDALNTLIPLDDVGAPQRSRYQSLRPDLAVPTSLLGPTEIGVDPELGTRLALHPSLAPLEPLFGEGRLAIVNGVGLAESSLSHFEAQEVWFSGDPSGLAATGWVGRHLDGCCGSDGIPHALSLGSLVNPTLASLSGGAIAAYSVDSFALPDDPEWRYRDLASRRLAWGSIFSDARAASPLAERIARAGGNLVSTSDLFGRIQTRGWGSRNEDVNGRLGHDLWQVASVLRHDALHSGDASGMRFFHLAKGGFDSHAQQGSSDASSGHPQLLDQLARALAGFQADLDDLGASGRVVTLVYSEFGRRGYQNANGANAGTDHGRAGIALLLGSPVAGGIYGRVPELDDLDSNGNLRVHTDFRRVYAALIDDWLGADHTSVLPGAPFAPLPVIA